jgi:hypothetical protein
MKLLPEFHSRTGKKIYLAAALVCLSWAGSNAIAGNITLDNTDGQALAIDPTDDLLYASSQGGGTQHLDVVNLQTDAVIGTYTYSSGGSAGVAAEGTSVFLAQQDTSQVLDLTVNPAGGTPVLTRTDTYASNLLPTGIAALSTTYGVTMQDSDSLNVTNSSTGVSIANVALTSAAGNVYSDPTSNVYLADSGQPGNFQTKVVSSTGTVVQTLSNVYTLALNANPSMHFVYSDTSSNSSTLLQLNGSTYATTGNSFAFSSAIDYVSVDPTDGYVWVDLDSSNNVYELSSSLALLGIYSVSDPTAMAALNGIDYVQVGNSNTLQALQSTPEPGVTVLFLFGLGGMLFLVLRQKLHRPEKEAILLA